MARHKILTFTVMYFIQAWTLGVDSKMVHLHQPGLNSPKPLDMVPNSVDDMYNGCTEHMYNKVQKEYLPKENKTEIFRKPWLNAEKCASKKKNEDKLSIDHIKAICAYTVEDPKIYPVFNQEVRTNSTVYRSTFHFHSLHFFLTDALRLLKENQQRCYNTFRRTNMEFGGEVNQIIRFGFFASSSLNKGISEKFGNKSCFNITTCSGAFLKSYPVLGSHEMEVLIPPFEMFNITKKGQKFLNCETLYNLESVGLQSNLNCQAV